MGLSRRKKSGKKIGGSSLIVVGQDIYSTKTFKPDFNKKRKPYTTFDTINMFQRHMMMRRQNSCSVRTKSAIARRKQTELLGIARQSLVISSSRSQSPGCGTLKKG